MITISLCMIVRDEESVLGRLLEQMKGVVDEIIIVDTGSVDKTEEIARQYTSSVFHYQWHDDFAAARNFACQNAAMDYWMWLDADDAVTPENQARLLELKRTLEPDTDVVMMRYATGFDEKGKANFSYYRERLIRNGKGFRWEGRVHEAVTPAGKVVYSDVVIEHRKVFQGDPDRNLRIYEDMLCAGEEFSPRSLFYYGRELLYHQRYEEAAAVLEKFLETEEGWKENKIDACLQAARCYEKMGNAEKRMGLLLESFRYDIPRAEVCCDMGRLFMEKRDFEKAAYWYGQALAVPDRYGEGGFEQKEFHGFIPLIQLCVCCDRMGDINGAWQYHLRSAVLKPEDESVRKNQRYFERLFAER